MQQIAKMYRETQVTTTSPGQILVMLYDGALSYLTRAKERIEAKDVKEKGVLISKALDVIDELGSALNAEKGGTLAANLRQLYFFCTKRLFMANLKMDTTMIDEVMKILSGLRSAYAQIMDSPEAVAAYAQVEASRNSAPQAQAGIKHTHAAMPVMPAAAQGARMRGAYAQQAAAAAPSQAVPVAAPVTPVAEAASSATPVPDPVPQTAEVPAVPIVAAGSPDIVPLLDTDDPTPGTPEPVPTPPPGLLGANRRLAASALYRKFS